MGRRKRSQCSDKDELHFELNIEKNCLLCDCLLENKCSEISSSQSLESGELFNVLCKIFNVNLPIDLQWNFNTECLPFCQFCTSTSFEILLIREKIGGLERELKIKQDNIKRCIVVSDLTSTRNTNRKSCRKIVQANVSNRYKSFRSQVIKTCDADFLKSCEIQSTISAKVKQPQCLRIASYKTDHPTICNTSKSSVYNVTISDVEYDPQIIVQCQTIKEEEDERENDSTFDSFLDSDIERNENNEWLDESLQVESFQPEETQNSKSEKLKPGMKISYIEANSDTDAVKDKILIDGSETMFLKDESTNKLVLSRPQVKTANKPKQDKSKESESTNTKVNEYDPIEITESGKMFYTGVEILPTDGGFKCCKCNKSFEDDEFPDSYLAQQHIYSLHRDSFQCDQCEKVFSYFKSLREHKRVVHDEIKYECVTCEKSFRTAKTLRSHRLSHQSQKEKESAERKRVELKKYGRIETTEDGKMFYIGVEILNTDEGYGCGLCSKQFNHENFECIRNKLKRHIRSHKESYICPECGKVTTTNADLQRHIKSVHEKLTQDCKICGKPLRYNIRMKHHIWTHKSEEEKQSAIAAGEKPPHTPRSEHEPKKMCIHCGKLFLTTTELEKHETRVHKDVNIPNNVQCPMCEKFYKNKDSLDKHLLYIHNTSKRIVRYECNICQKSFPVQNRLKLHMRLHTGEKPYKCEVCSKLYRTNAALKIHSSSHTGIRPYKCDVCSASYPKIWHLKRHLAAGHKFKTTQSGVKAPRKRVKKLIKSEILVDDAVKMEVSEHSEVVNFHTDLILVPAIEPVHEVTIPFKSLY